MESKAAYSAGFDAGVRWRGDFLPRHLRIMTARAERAVAGRPFRELLGGPTQRDRDALAVWVAGFGDGLEAR